jgi:hypothetical protein
MRMQNKTWVKAENRCFSDKLSVTEICKKKKKVTSLVVKENEGLFFLTYVVILFGFFLWLYLNYKGARRNIFFIVDVLENY